MLVFSYYNDTLGRVPADVRGGAIADFLSLTELMGQLYGDLAAQAGILNAVWCAALLCAKHS